MRKSTCFIGMATVAVLLAGTNALAQTPSAQPFAFPEVQGPPPPPGAPTMQEALAAYLGGRAAAAAAPAAGAPAAPRPAPPPPPGRTLPPIKTIGPVPNPAHITFTLPEDLPWQGRVGQNQTVNLVGNPTEPGPYLQLMKWWPGAYSGPHMHPNTRNMMIISGTWWVSDSPIQDKTKTYPLVAGTHVVEPPYTYHWDGARNEPAVIMIWGNGPSPNIAVDEKGMPRPRPAAPAAAAPAAPAR